MAAFASLDGDQPVTCAACHSNWNVEFLMVDIGRARLRAHGFTFLWFDDGMIGVNTCPHCELPVLSRETFSWLSEGLQLA